ncbi:hypothetical protein ACSBR2_000575 [Camellia fascicularis]
MLHHHLPVLPSLLPPQPTLHHHTHCRRPTKPQTVTHQVQECGHHLHTKDLQDQNINIDLSKSCSSGEKCSNQDFLRQFIFELYLLLY